MVGKGQIIITAERIRKRVSSIRDNKEWRRGSHPCRERWFYKSKGSEHRV